MKLIYLKTTNSEDIVAELIEQNADGFKIRNPLKFIHTLDYGIGALIWNYPAKDNTLTLKYAHVMFNQDVDEDIIDKYKNFREKIENGIVDDDEESLNEKSGIKIQPNRVLN